MSSCRHTPLISLPKCCSRPRTEQQARTTTAFLLRCTLRAASSLAGLSFSSMGSDTPAMRNSFLQTQQRIRPVWQEHGHQLLLDPADGDHVVRSCSTQPASQFQLQALTAVPSALSCNSAKHKC